MTTARAIGHVRWPAGPAYRRQKHESSSIRCSPYGPPRSDHRADAGGPAPNAGPPRSTAQGEPADSRHPRGCHQAVHLNIPACRNTCKTDRTHPRGSWPAPFPGEDLVATRRALHPTMGFPARPGGDRTESGPPALSCRVPPGDVTVTRQGVQQRDPNGVNSLSEGRHLTGRGPIFYTQTRRRNDDQ